MDAGKLDQRITLQRVTETVAAGGGRVRTWSNLPSIPNVWAMVRSRAVREALDNGRMNASYMAEFTIWNRNDVDETCRIIWNGETYNIRGIRREGLNRATLTIEAERGAAS